MANRALLDAYQWRSILGMAELRPSDPLFGPRLKKALKGGVEIGEPDQGRDAQFELFTLASLRSDLSPKLRPDTFGGADIILENACIAIECKRPTSKERFWELFDKGSDQVHCTAAIGVVATDLTAFIDQRWPQRVEHFDEAGPALARDIEAVMLKELGAQSRRSWMPKPSTTVWSGSAFRFHDVAGTIMGPFGIWVHLIVDDSGEQSQRIGERVAEAFAHPSSFSFFEPE